MERTIEFMPDAYSYGEGGLQQVGAVSQYVGLGITTHQPVVVVPFTAFLMREAPSVLPLLLDDNNMVIALREGGKVDGIQEGDTVLSYSGHALEKDPQLIVRSPFLLERLRMVPGTRVEVVAIRPGSGRVKGALETMSNPRTYLVMPNLPEADHLEVKSSNTGGKTRWSVTRKGVDASPGFDG